MLIAAQLTKKLFAICGTWSLLSCLQMPVSARQNQSTPSRLNPLRFILILPFLYVWIFDWQFVWVPYIIDQWQHSMRVSSSWFENSKNSCHKVKIMDILSMLFFLACCHIVLGSDILLRSVLKQPFNVREQIYVHNKRQIRFCTF